MEIWILNAKMTEMRKYFIAVFVFLSLPAFCQEGTVAAIASEQGNLIRFWSTARTQAFENTLKNTRRFIVHRNEITPAEPPARPVGTVEFPRTAAHVRSALPSGKYEAFQQYYGLPDDAAVDNYLGAGIRLDSVMLHTESSADFLVAFGLGYLDRDVEKGRIYEYTVYREDLDGLREPWGNAVVIAKEGNFELEKIQTNLERISASDSSVVFVWSVSLPEFTGDTLLPEPEKPSRLNALFNRNALLQTYAEKITPYINRYPLNVINTAFSIYYRVNDTQDWQFAGKFLAVSDSTDALRVSVHIPCLPEDLLEAVVIPEDFAGNRGPQSAPARGVAVTSRTVKLIYALTARDSVNSILLQWEPLPERPYYAGIEISKSGNDSLPQVVAVLPPDATGYTDYRVFPAGTIFTYYARPLFLPFQELEQEIPAMVMHSCTTFSRPAIPYNLKATDREGLVQLTWDAADDPAFYSFHVLRGIHPDELNIISGNVFEKTFTDSADYLSPRLTYYYAVMAMNLAQDTSAYSDYVSYVPTQKPRFDSPPVPGHEIINKDVLLRWDDVKLNDEYISGYLLQRKKEGENEFASLHTGLLSTHYFLDTTFRAGETWYYRVASVSVRGDTATFSPVVTIGGPLPEPEVMPVTEIEAINLSKSVRITWPAVFSGSIDRYKIYRRLPEDPQFREIGSRGVGQAEFEDTEVTPGKVYVYSVTAVNLKGKESRIITERSVYRE